MPNLISLDTYKQAKALTKSDSDERLSILIEGVSNLIKTYCGTSFLDYNTTPKEEYYRVESDSCEAIQLKEFPVIEVLEVQERSTYDADYLTLVEGTDFLVDAAADMLYRINGFWPKGINSVLVTYTSGYLELPSDLKLAAVDLITYYFKEEHKKQQSSGQATRQNVGTTSLRDDTGFPDHIRRVLDMYRQI